MRRRGPIVGLVGTAITAGSFLALLSATSGLDGMISVNGELPPMRDLLEGLFTDVSDEATVFAGGSAEFHHEVSGGGEDGVLFWAVEIADYEEGDAYLVSAADALGASLYGPAGGSERVMFGTIDDAGSGPVVFTVGNDGGRDFQAVMMFNSDPGGAGRPMDSPLLAAFVPIAVAGIAMLAGMAVMAAGAVVALVDWRKTRGQQGSSAGGWRRRGWE